MSIRRTSLEICTDDSEAWSTFLSICSEAFQDHGAFKRSHPDPDKRKRFIPAYFNYIFETEMSNGRAGLACVKIEDENGYHKIIYGLCGIFPNSKKTKRDCSIARRISPMGFKRCMEEDEWMEKNVHEKMKKVFNSLGMSYINCTYHACLQEYMNNGIGSRYMVPAAKVVLEDGIRRGLIPREKPAVAYGILDDARPGRLQADNGVTEIAHLHYRTPPYCEMKCVQHSKESCKDDCNCVFIICKEIGERRFLMDNISREFSFLSKL